MFFLNNNEYNTMTSSTWLTIAVQTDCQQYLFNLLIREALKKQFLWQMSNLLWPPPSCDKNPTNFFHLKNTFWGIENFPSGGLKFWPETPKNFVSKNTFWEATIVNPRGGGHSYRKVLDLSTVGLTCRVNVPGLKELVFFENMLHWVVGTIVCVCAVYCYSTNIR